MAPQVIFAAATNGPIARSFATETRVRVDVTPRGWQTAESFRDYLLWVLPTLGKHNHGLVDLDLHASHLCAETAAELKKRHWRMKFIPGGCTSVCQVHDPVVNKEFKAALRASLGERRSSDTW